MQGIKRDVFFYLISFVLTIGASKLANVWQGSLLYVKEFGSGILLNSEYPDFGILMDTLQRLLVGKCSVAPPKIGWKEFR